MSDIENQEPQGAGQAHAIAAGGDASKATPDTVFGSKVPLGAKIAIALALVAIFLVSFCMGSYSMAAGHGLPEIWAAVVQHMPMYFFNAVDQISQGNVLEGLAGTDVPFLVSDQNLDRSLFSIRLPRILLVILVGAALSTAGASFQGMFKNPLVSPDLLGASAGASLGACLMMLTDAPNIGIQLGAFIGGLLAVGLTVWMRGIVKSDAILGLVLAGMLVSTLFQSGMSFVKLVADTDSKLPAITYWLMGSFNSVTGKDFWVALVPMLIGFALMLSQSWKLNVMSFGDDEARAMGVNTRKARLIVILGATLVSSTSVAVAGIIGWVGLVIPHFARAIVGPNYKVLLPTCVGLGAAYLLLIDDIARMAFGGVEIPIGILTAILGVPFFLVIFRRSNRGW